jgi:hypothetical protein
MQSAFTMAGPTEAGMTDAGTGKSLSKGSDDDVVGFYLMFSKRLKVSLRDVGFGVNENAVTDVLQADHAGTGRGVVLGFEV